MGPSYFNSVSNLVTQRFLCAKVIVEAISSRPFFILFDKTSTKQQQFNQHKALRRLNDDMPTTVSIKVAQRLSQEEEAFQNVVGNSKTEEELMLTRSHNQEQINWKKSIIIP